MFGHVIVVTQLNMNQTPMVVVHFYCLITSGGGVTGGNHCL